MKPKSADWVGLANAAVAARNDLRGLIPHLDREIATAGEHAPLLRLVRAVCWRQADGLRLALKGRCDGRFRNAA